MKKFIHKSNFSQRRRLLKVRDIILVMEKFMTNVSTNDEEKGSKK